MQKAVCTVSAILAECPGVSEQFYDHAKTVTVRRVRKLSAREDPSRRSSSMRRPERIWFRIVCTACRQRARYGKVRCWTNIMAMHMNMSKGPRNHSIEGAMVASSREGSTPGRKAASQYLKLCCDLERPVPSHPAAGFVPLHDSNASDCWIALEEQRQACMSAKLNNILNRVMYPSA